MNQNSEPVFFYNIEAKPNSCEESEVHRCLNTINSPFPPINILGTNTKCVSVY